MRILVLTNLTAGHLRFGTELVAHDLALEWAGAGHDVTLCGPVESGPVLLASSAGGVNVMPLPPGPPRRRVDYFARDVAPPPDFAGRVDELAPDVAVVVGFGPAGITLAWLDLLAQRGVPVALWHHMASVTCQQRFLQYKDRTPCDGRVTVRRCTACRLTAAGAPEPIAEAAALLPLPLAAARLPGRLGRAAGGRALTAAFARSVEGLRGRTERVFVGADWVGAVLAANGFAPERITRVRPGLRRDLGTALAGTPRPPRAPALRLACWGRIESIKGVEVAIGAVRMANEAAPDGGDVTLDIIGPFDPAQPYHRYLARLAAGDGRIVFTGRLEAAALAARLAQADAAVIASTCQETGPLTVFEAHAAGLPVLGSDLGGIGEICGPDPSARLFPAGDAAALGRLIRALLADRAEVERRRALVPRARTMADVAAEILPVLEQMAPDAAYGRHTRQTRRLAPSVAKRRGG
ncbi:glycosyltransferase [Acuticoccus yangtzensis]|uniref:glycosyltransferase n=1 Tax=Acuticoccus yangtzensis TaxID=1443441 RepID=UPI00094962CA|nr:glycosyltransferase [Acuticoccus yangtzensis]